MPAKEIKVSKSKSDSAGAKKLDRSKLHSISNIAKSTEEEGSLRAIIILIVVIIVVAVGGAYFIKNLQSQVENPTEEAAVENDIEEDMIVEEPEVDVNSVVDSILSTEVMADIDAPHAVPVEEYTDEDKEIEALGESTYSLASIKAQPYESFYRISYKFTTEDTEAEMKVPGVNANVRNIVPEIVLTFMNTNGDKSGLLDGQAVAVNESILASIVKSPESTDNELIYQLKLSDLATYNLQFVEDELIIDLWEIEPRTLPGEEEVDMDVEDTETETEEDMNKEEGAVEETQEEKEEVKEESTAVSTSSDVKSDATGKVAGIKGYTYDDTVEKFVYRLALSNNHIPNVTSSVNSDNTISVKINNLVFDAIARESEYANVTFAEAVKDVNSVKASYSDGLSTYVFSVDGKTDYNIEIGTYEGEKVLLIEFMH